MLSKSYFPVTIAHNNTPKQQILSRLLLNSSFFHSSSILIFFSICCLKFLKTHFWSICNGRFIDPRIFPCTTSVGKNITFRDPHPGCNLLKILITFLAHRKLPGQTKHFLNLISDLRYIKSGELSWTLIGHILLISLKILEAIMHQTLITA